MLRSVATTLALACIGPRTPGALRRDRFAGAHSGYDKYTRPALAVAMAANTSEWWLAPSDEVQAVLKVRALREVNPSTGTFTLDAVVGYYWTDARLSFPSSAEGGCFHAEGVEFAAANYGEIWHPDPYFINAVGKVSQDILKFRISPNGRVYVSYASVFTLACAMEFSKMPFDTQHCDLDIGLWQGRSYNTLLSFKKPSQPASIDSKGVGGTVEWKLNLTGGAVRNHTAAGSLEPILYFYMDMERESDYFVYYRILPCIVLVFMSWTTFFLTRGALPARVASGFLCFLTLSNFQNSVLAQLPQYEPREGILLLKFMKVCIYFCAFTVFEGAMVSFATRIEARYDKARAQKPHASHARVAQAAVTIAAGAGGKRDHDAAPGDVEMAEKKNADLAAVERVAALRAAAGRAGRFLVDKHGELRVRDQHIDLFSRWVFPPAYLIANLVVFL
tara:strand:+ start:476 stop:1816 length:1341 start_codon:yes stop_codon:yes gene_type:complete